MDLKLLLFITSTVTLVTGAVLLITWQRNGRQSDVALFWSIAFFITSVAWILAIVLPKPYTLFSVLLLALAFFAAPVFLLAGVFVRGGRPPPWRVFIAVGVLCMLIQLWYCIVEADDVMRTLNLTVFNLLFHLLVVFLSLKSQADRAGNIMLAIGSTSIAAVLVVRIYLLVQHLTNGGDAAMLLRDEILIFLFMPSAMVIEGLACLGAILLDLINKLTHQAYTDPMTDCLNRRGFEEAAANNIAIANRHQLPISTVICDIDHFKRINDRFGHCIGDDVIKAFACILTDSARDADLVGRMGGEEFVILLLGCKLQDGIEYSQRVRNALRKISVLAVAESINLTASFGVTELLAGDECLENMVRRADKALYSAKGGGRDRIETCLSAADRFVLPGG